MDDQNMDVEAEHKFFRDWMKRLDNKQPISREELELVVAHSEWIYSVTDILNDACIFRLITVDDAVWAQRHFDAESYIHKQLETFIQLENDSTDWKELLLLALANRTNWAAKEILTALSASDIDEAKAMIASSSRPKSVKNQLLGVLKEVEKRNK